MATAETNLGRVTFVAEGGIRSKQNRPLEPVSPSWCCKYGLTK